MDKTQPFVPYIENPIPRLPLPELMLLTHNGFTVAAMERAGIVLKRDTVSVVRNHQFVEYTLPDGWTIHDDTDVWYSPDFTIVDSDGNSRFIIAGDWFYPDVERPDRLYVLHESEPYTKYVSIAD